jgi:hypothetical protein
MNSSPNDYPWILLLSCKTKGQLETLIWFDKRLIELNLLHEPVPELRAMSRVAGEEEEITGAIGNCIITRCWKSTSASYLR